VIVEIGSMRQPITHPLDESNHPCCNDGHSSALWARTGAEFYTVDFSKECSDTTRRELHRLKFHNATVINDDGIRFLENFGKKIDLLYLDAWDVNFPGSAENHLKAYLAARGKLQEKCVLLIDDTDVELVGGSLVLTASFDGGKGRLVVPQAQQDGFTLVSRGRQTLLVRA
jgi:hypothetical protein